MPAALFALLSLVLLGAPPPPPANLPGQGLATYYAPGLMGQVAQARQRYHQITPCPECQGYIAALSCADLDRRVWLEYQGHCAGPYQVVDCADARDYQALSGRNLVAEVDYDQAQAWGMRGPITLTLRDRPPLARDPLP